MECIVLPTNDQHRLSEVMSPFNLRVIRLSVEVKVDWMAEAMIRLWLVRLN